jgi:SAM-dependent methyltransferase
MSYLKVVYSKTRAPKTTYPSKLVKYLIKRFKLKKGDRLLELGVGNGDFLGEFKREGLDCYGVDREFSPDLKSDLKIKKVDLTRRKLPYSNDSFDVIYHKSVLEHFYSNQVDFIMKESCRVLKKGGKLIILVPDWVSQMKTYFEDYTQVHPYDSLAIADLLGIYNFKKIKSEKFYQLPVVWEYRSLRYLSWFLGIFLSTSAARKITEITGWKFIRWSVELMVLGYGEK